MSKDRSDPSSPTSPPLLGGVSLLTLMAPLLYKFVRALLIERLEGWRGNTSSTSECDEVVEVIPIDVSFGFSGMLLSFLVSWFFFYLSNILLYLSLSIISED